MSVSQIMETKPLGTVFAISDGKPKPPAHHKRKLADWQYDNTNGTLVEVSDCSFTMLIKRVTAHGVEIMRLFRTFTPETSSNFTVVSHPDPATILVAKIYRHTIELVGTADTEEEAVNLEHQYRHAEPFRYAHPAHAQSLTDIAA
jgi:hypothetical protein